MQIFALRLKPEMDLRKSLWEFVQKNNIQAGFILTTVGSLKQASIRLAGKSDSQIFTGDLEIVSLSGTLSQDGVHLHMAISDAEGKTIGGHLSNGTIVRTTAEIVVGESLAHRFSRVIDAQTGYQELEVKDRG
ncbi:DNA-binding protein [Kovacikia minuta CCNUW1]|uniref:PPC domain-containing DNA-binding protein n=1 Tax=Kovacikia minuta TaxID=2931930 RepID=UPI001CCFE6D6|nr:PPC domain-containing DNA-binding protein [Kovacikia minuta]UBF23659.1 DNA-binding protein [Kovacikia minuta CCNUW1]